MDLDAVLDRHPQVVLVDELAHTNVPGSGRHEKRWQDVIELLDAGIDVITTVNIQHLESIADAVERIIDVPIRERVPDWVLRKADQIELVDSSPEQLRRRMVHGNIYPPEQVARGADPLLPHRQPDRPAGAGPALPGRRDRGAAPRVSAAPTEGRRLGDPRADPGGGHHRPGHRRHRSPGVEDGRAGSRPISRWCTSRPGKASPASPRTTELVALRQLAADVGAAWNEVRGDDPAQALIDFARQRAHHPDRGRLERAQPMAGADGGGSIVRKISRLAAAAGIDVHIIARQGRRPSSLAESPEAADEFLMVARPVSRCRSSPR